jgi:hypothetical protein
MGSVAWIVEHFYPMLVPIVILAAAYVIILRCQRSLLIPFILGLLVMAAVFYLTHWWPIFFISLPSMFTTLWIPVIAAAYLSYAIRWMLRRLAR